MKEKLNNKLRTFLIAMSFPVLFSSGCSKIEDRVAMSSYPHKTIMDADKLRDDFLESFAQYFDSRDLEYTGMESLLYGFLSCICDSKGYFDHHSTHQANLRAADFGYMGNLLPHHDPT